MLPVETAAAAGAAAAPSRAAARARPARRRRVADKGGVCMRGRSSPDRAVWLRAPGPPRSAAAEDGRNQAEPDGHAVILSRVGYFQRPPPQEGGGAARHGPPTPLRRISGARLSPLDTPARHPSVSRPLSL